MQGVEDAVTHEDGASEEVSANSMDDRRACDEVEYAGYHERDDLECIHVGEWVFGAWRRGCGQYEEGDHAGYLRYRGNQDERQEVPAVGREGEIDDVGEPHAGQRGRLVARGGTVLRGGGIAARRGAARGAEAVPWRIWLPAVHAGDPLGALAIV